MSDLIFPSVPGAIYSKGTPLYRELVQESDSGVEYRIRKWSRPRYRHSITWNFLRRGDAYKEAQTIASFLCMHGARHESFLFRDPWDYSVAGMGFGIGDAVSTRFPLQRSLGGVYTNRLGTWTCPTIPRWNYCLRSQELGASPWSLSEGAGGSVSVTADAGIAPDGTLTADLVTYPSTNTLLAQSISSTFPSGVTWTLSLWLKGTAGLGVRLVIVGAGGGTEEAAEVVTLTGEWQRASVSVTFAHGNHTALWWCTQRLDSAGASASSCMQWGAQVEHATYNPTPSPYIPTTSAVVTADPGLWTAHQSTAALVAPAATGPFEPVTEPDWSAVTIYQAGVALTPGTHWTPGSGGIVTMVGAPPGGVHLSWTGTYHKRVRFDDEEPEFDRIAGDIVSGGAIDLVTVI